MEMKLSKWGNGYGVRIPKEVLNSIGISSEKLNEDCVKLETTVENGKLVISKSNTPLENYSKTLKATQKIIRWILILVTQLEMKFGRFRVERMIK